MRTLVLKRNSVLAPYKSPSATNIPNIFKDPEGYWTGFSARSRVIVYNTNLVKPDEAPKSIFDLADPKWKNQIAIADPRFGSTSFTNIGVRILLTEKSSQRFNHKGLSLNLLVLCFDLCLLLLDGIDQNGSNLCVFDALDLTVCSSCY